MYRWSLNLVVGTTAFAWAGIAQAACLSERQQIPVQTVEAFLASPIQILQQFPGGGGGVITQVRDLVATDPAALPAIMALLANANPDQKTAIGSGLGQAARLCARQIKHLKIRSSRLLPRPMIGRLLLPSRR